MEAVNGYQRTALVLQPLDAVEREWFLSQLDEDDRRRVTALLRDADEAGAAAPAEAARASAAPPARDEAPDDIALLERAHGDTLSAVLHDQPEWVVALVLAHCRKNMALRRYVDELAQPRCGRIHGLVKEMQDSVKPKVRDAVLRRIAADAERHERTEPRAPNFDSMLTNFTVR